MSYVTAYPRIVVSHTFCHCSWDMDGGMEISFLLLLLFILHWMACGWMEDGEVCLMLRRHGAWAEGTRQAAARTPSSFLLRSDLCRVSRSAGPRAEKVRWCWRARGPRGTPHAVPAETPADTRRPRPWRPAPQVISN